MFGIQMGQLLLEVAVLDILFRETPIIPLSISDFVLMGIETVLVAWERQNLYGWARTTLNDDGSFDGVSNFTIHEWAYEDSGSSILVGAGGAVIPEPTSASLGLLALGAAGLRRWRKRTA